MVSIERLLYFVPLSRPRIAIKPSTTKTRPTKLKTRKLTRGLLLKNRPTRKHSAPITINTMPGLIRQVPILLSVSDDRLGALNRFWPISVFVDEGTPTTDSTTTGDRNVCGTDANVLIGLMKQHCSMFELVHPS